MAKDPEQDERVARLVHALDAFPGVESYSSCGGHPPPLEESQCPANEFFVCFDVGREERGWRALEFIAWAAAEAADGAKEIATSGTPSARVITWVKSDEPGVGTVSFELSGTDFHPDEVAILLEALTMTGD